jgi:hypothetical protein
MLAKLEVPPRVVRWGRVRFSHSHNRRGLLVSVRSFNDSPESQGAVFIGDGIIIWGQACNIAIMSNAGNQERRVFQSCNIASLTPKLLFIGYLGCLF